MKVLGCEIKIRKRKRKTGGGQRKRKSFIRSRGGKEWNGGIFMTKNLPQKTKDEKIVIEKVEYNTRLASKDSYYTSKVTTNYGKFNIRHVGA